MQSVSFVAEKVQNTGTMAFTVGGSAIGQTVAKHAVSEAGRVSKVGPSLAPAKSQTNAAVINRSSVSNVQMSSVATQNATSTSEI